jgi:hypothetical protein
MFKRKERRAALINLTEHSAQLARLSHLNEAPVTVDQLLEVPITDTESVARWLEENFPKRRGGFFIPGYGGFYPPEFALVRESIAARRLAEPWYLASLIEEHGKVASAKEWQIAALHTTEGTSLDAESPQRSTLLLGVPSQAIRDTQQRLLQWGVRPRRLEIGTLALLGAMTRYFTQQALPHAIAVCEIGATQTRLYFVGKDGVHTPPPLPHGLLSIEEAAMKELSAPDAGAALRQLAQPSETLRAHSRRLVRMLSRHLRPAVDYFEMQTGQRAGALFCAHLPEKLGWLEEALCAAVDLEFVSPDLGTWLPQSGLQLAPGIAASRSWLQPLSLIGQLAPQVAPASVVS